MATNGADSQKQGPPDRPRHQITRSISEISSPIRLHRHTQHRPRSRDRDDKTAVPQSATPALQGRASLDAARSEGVTPNLSPNPSRRASVLIASEDNATPPTSLAQPVKRLTKEEELQLERERAAARATYVTPSRICTREDAL